MEDPSEEYKTKVKFEAEMSLLSTIGGIFQQEKFERNSIFIFQSRLG